MHKEEQHSMIFEARMRSAGLSAQHRSARRDASDVPEVSRMIVNNSLSSDFPANSVNSDIESVLQRENIQPIGARNYYANSKSVFLIGQALLQLSFIDDCKGRKRHFW